MRRLLFRIAPIALPVWIGFFMFVAPYTNAFSLFPSNCGSNGSGSSAVCADKGEGNTASDPISGKNGLILRVSRIIAVVAGIAAVIMIIIGGFRMILSAGSSENAAAARKTVIFALVGLVVIILAETIITFVVSNI